jgi:hypothetical protein
MRAKKIQTVPMRVPVDVYQFISERVIYPYTAGETLRELLGLKVSSKQSEEGNGIYENKKKKNRKSK